MTKTSKLQLNQPDATAGSFGPHHAKIIATAQHRARLDARKREALDVGRWMFVPRRGSGFSGNSRRRCLYGGIRQNLEKSAKLS
jgi:hypothetical protein